MFQLERHCSEFVLNKTTVLPDNSYGIILRFIVNDTRS